MGAVDTNARIMGRWYITPHAVEAYIRRVCPCTREQALVDLATISERAHYVKPAAGAAQLWRGPRKRIGKGRRTGGIRLIVGPGEGNLPALLTVLGEHDDATGGTI
jgi:hypothetical protein